MRILVGHDYYDSGMGFGHDDHTVFVREKDRTLPCPKAEAGGLMVDDVALRFEEISSGKGVSFQPSRNEVRYKDTDYKIQQVAAVVCGKKHNGLLVSKSARCTTHGHIPEERVFFWSHDALNDWLAKDGIRAVDGHHYWLYGRGNKVKLQDYFGVRELPQQALNFVIAERITLLTFIEPAFRSERPSNWMVNAANLKEIQFFKVMDAYSLFQEIDMWVGGVLASSGNPTVEITDDKIKIAKHGFDKGSFRKPKQAVE